MKTQMGEQTALQALQDCLGKISFLQVEYIGPIRGGQGPDLQAVLRVQGRPVEVFAEYEDNGLTRWARQAVYVLKGWLAERPGAYGVFIAPYISPAAAAICKEAQIGYLDLAGNCHLSFETVYVHQEGYPNPFPQRRDLRSLYSPKAERILRVLLTQSQCNACAAPTRQHLLGWKTEALAEAAEVSFGQVSNVKKLLADREWLLLDAAGIRLSNPGALLDDWTQQYKYRRNRVTDYYSMTDVTESEYRLAETCQHLGLRYALTGFSGAARLAPAVRYQRVMAYIQGDLGALTDALGWKPVPSGANISLLAPYDEGVFYLVGAALSSSKGAAHGARDMDGVQIAAPVQVYLDLQSYRGRGQEAAEAVRKEMEKSL